MYNNNILFLCFHPFVVSKLMLFNPFNSTSIKKTSSIYRSLETYIVARILQNPRTVLTTDQVAINTNDMRRVLSHAHHNFPDRFRVIDMDNIYGTRANTLSLEFIKNSYTKHENKKNYKDKSQALRARERSFTDFPVDSGVCGYLIYNPLLVFHY